MPSSSTTSSQRCITLRWAISRWRAPRRPRAAIEHHLEHRDVADFRRLRRIHERHATPALPGAPDRRVRLWRLVRAALAYTAAETPAIWRDRVRTIREVRETAPRPSPTRRDAPLLSIRRVARAGRSTR